VLSRPALTDPRDVVLDPGAVLAGWLTDGVPASTDGRHLLRLADGRLLPLPLARWAGPPDLGDESMLSRATEPVLDVGCGPGRLTAALHDRGVEVLGLELLESVPVLARRSGAPLLVGDVFAPVPGAGRWRTVLLADGNLGIGGDPVRLLRRVRTLLAPGGQVLCELHPYGVGDSGPVRLESDGTTSAWFAWALVDQEELAHVAGAADLQLAETWQAQGRCFGVLVRAQEEPGDATGDDAVQDTVDDRSSAA
jgi:SAM-dependent methyltransferase